MLTCSAQENEGLESIWAQVLAHRAHLERQGALKAKRQKQQWGWVWATVDESLRRGVRQHPEVKALASQLEAQLAAHQTTPSAAAQALLDAVGWGLA